MNLAALIGDLGEVAAVLTPAFVVLTLWRLHRVEQKLEKLNDALNEHFLDNARKGVKS
jgi:hypothetical protein